MQEFPKDVKMEIFASLPDKDLTKLCLLNKSFFDLCNDDYFWKIHLEKMYPTDAPFFLQSKIIKQKYGKNYKKLYSDLKKIDKLRKKFTLFESNTLYSFFLIKHFPWKFMKDAVPSRSTMPLPEEVLLFPKLETIEMGTPLSDTDMELIAKLPPTVKII